MTTFIEDAMFSLAAAGVNYGNVAVPPPLVPSPVNLVRSSRNPTDPARWTNGITYVPSSVGTLAIESDCAPESVDVPTDVNTSQVFWQPYVLQAEYFCSTVGYDQATASQRAAQLLDAATPKMIEYELWNGLLAQAAGFSNLYLMYQSADPTNYTATSIEMAVGIAEQYLAATGYGGRGMIHCSPFLSAYLRTVVRREGNLILTDRDTIVVPGSGYGPQGSGTTPPTLPPVSDELYVTGITDVRVGEILTVPDEFGQSIDRATNTITTRAERYALASWDGVALAKVTITGLT